MPVVYAKLWLISAADPNEMLRTLSGIIGYMGDPLMSDVIDLFHDAILFCGLIARIGQLRLDVDVLFNDLGGRETLEHALPSTIIGMIEADEQGLKIEMIGNINPKNFAGDTTVKTFHHSIGLGRIGLRRTTDDFEFHACFCEDISGEAGPKIREHMGDAEWKGLSCPAQEGNIEITLADLSI